MTVPDIVWQDRKRQGVESIPANTSSLGKGFTAERDEEKGEEIKKEDRQIGGEREREKERERERERERKLNESKK